MGNCLKTQLKESVSNSELFVLGETIFNVVAQEEAINWSVDRLFSIRSKEDIVVSVRSGDIYFVNSDGTGNLGTTISIPANTKTTLHVSNGDGVISIISKYGINDLETENNTKGIIFDLSEFNYLGGNDDINLEFQCPNCVGDIKNLKYSKLFQFVVAGSGNRVYGDVSTLDFSNMNAAINIGGCSEIKGKFSNMGVGTIIAFNSGLTGDIEDFAFAGPGRYDFGGCLGIVGHLEYFVEKLVRITERTAVNIDLPSTVKLNNVAVNDQTYTINISGTSATIINDGSQVASYNGSTWTYNS